MTYLFLIITIFALLFLVSVAVSLVSLATSLETIVKMYKREDTDKQDD